jgi:hypothetical protein
MVKPQPGSDETTNNHEFRRVYSYTNVDSWCKEEQSREDRWMECKGLGDNAIITPMTRQCICASASKEAQFVENRTNRSILSLKKSIDGVARDHYDKEKKKKG